MGVEIESLRAKLSALAEEYAPILQSKKLEPGVHYLPPSGKVVGHEEFHNLLQASADLWLTAGRFAESFEAEFAKFWGSKRALLVNSGSSANLLAFAALTSPTLGDRQVKSGDEMITAACGFPTTVAPAIQAGVRPVFVDLDLTTHNALPRSIENAITDKTKVVMLAHTLGNAFDAEAIARICDERRIWLIEDCCDALGIKIGEKPVGTLGSLATCSFYPAHHMTLGEGGAVMTDDPKLYKIALSQRDWGRDCWCEPGISNTCGKRFEWKLGELPEGYDHKYIYSHLGYNLKATDFQAAVGLAQLKKAPGFIDARRQNHTYLTECLKQLGLEEHLILPQATPGTTPSWFGYLVTLREPGIRRKLVPYLEENKIGTRLLFGGNLTKQPAFRYVDYRIAEPLTQTDKLMEDAFWIGIWPGLEKRHLEYAAQKMDEGVRKILAMKGLR